MEVANVGPMQTITKFTLDTSGSNDKKFKPADHQSLASQGINGDIIAYSHPLSRRGYFIGKIIKAPKPGHGDMDNVWDTCWTVERLQPVMKKLKTQRLGEYWMNGQLVVDEYGSLTTPPPTITKHSKVHNAVQPIQVLWNDCIWLKEMDAKKKVGDPKLSRPWKRVPTTEPNYSDNFTSALQDPTIFFLCHDIGTIILKRMGGKPKLKSKKKKKNSSSSSSSLSSDNNNDNAQHFENDTEVQVQ